MNYLKKHKILKSLKEHYIDGEKKTGRGMEITKIGRSLSILQLNNKTKIIVDEIQDVCYSLEDEGLIEKTINDVNNKAHSYIITKKGIAYVNDKKFLNKVWYRNLGFYKDILYLLISIIALLNSIFHFISN